MNKSRFLLLALIGLLFSSCDDEKECLDDSKYCSSDNKSVFVCVDGKWDEISCGENKACGVMLNDNSSEVKCIEDSTPSSQCVTGTAVCTDTGLVKKCLASGEFSYLACAGKEKCEDGECKPIVTKGIVRRQCSEDKNSIESVDESGNITSKTCLEETGFASSCEDFGSGLAGCVLPNECNDVFSVYGKCINNKRLSCNDKLFFPKPQIEDCSALGQLCISDGGASSCRYACSETSDFTCSTDTDEMTSQSFEVVTRCRDLDGVKYVQRNQNICESETSSVACVNGNVVHTNCAADEKCNPVLGICTKACSEENLNDYYCSGSSAQDMKLNKCQKIADAYVYAPVGIRDCNDNVAVRCSADSGSIELKQDDCRDYHTKDKQGNDVVYKSVCIMAQSGIEDFDMCYGDNATECDEGLTENGRCDNANTVTYCNSMFNQLASESCTNNQKCAVYKNVADCMDKCSSAGRPACLASLDENNNVVSYTASVCVIDDNETGYYKVLGDAICFNNILYECSLSGNIKETNCAANGGRCDVNSCVYPSCSVDGKPVCLADDSMISCSTNQNGIIRGVSLESVWCDLDNACYRCQNGELKKIEYNFTK